MTAMLPYGRHLVDADDVRAVTAVLTGEWLTTGPAVDGFQDAFARFVDADHAVAVANGTAALHLAMLAAGIGPGDEVIVPTMTFAASANCVRYVGADVVFADVRDDTLTIDVEHAAALVTERTRAIVAVDYAGTPADLDPLLALAADHDLTLVEDACHAPGATYRGRRVGGIAHLSAFSFHPVKHVTTAEGGMVTTDDDTLAARLRMLRNHGITADFRERAEHGTWAYDMEELGFNYRLSDLACALGTSQLRKLPGWLGRRRELALRYADGLAGLDAVVLPRVPPDRVSAWHLYPVRVDGTDPAEARGRLYAHLRANGVAANVHYRPVHLHSYYRRLGHRPGSLPVAERAYEGLLTLPLWPGLTDAQQDHVIGVVRGAVEPLS